MQLRGAADLRGQSVIKLDDGSSVKVSQNDAKILSAALDKIRTPMRKKMVQSLSKNKREFNSVTNALKRAWAKIGKYAMDTGLSLAQVGKLGPQLIINSQAVEAFADEFGTVGELNIKLAKDLRVQRALYGAKEKDVAKLSLDSHRPVFMKNDYKDIIKRLNKLEKKEK